jgi:hypothetical protein
VIKDFARLEVVIAIKLQAACLLVARLTFELILSLLSLDHLVERQFAHFEQGGHFGFKQLDL